MIERMMMMIVVVVVVVHHSHSTPTTTIRWIRATRNTRMMGKSRRRRILASVWLVHQYLRVCVCGKNNTHHQRNTKGLFFDGRVRDV